MMTYNILVYGDSNTYGYVPGSMDWSTFTYERFPKEIRWPGCVQNGLGTQYNVIEEGLPGRTIVTSEPGYPNVDGLTSLYACLQLHKPIDLVIIMLGTNDLKKSSHLSVIEITRQLENMCRAVINVQSRTQSNYPGILIIAPPNVNLMAKTNPMLEPYQHIKDEFKQLAISFRNLANKNHYYFYDGTQIKLSDDSDGVHLDQEAHLQLAFDLIQLIRFITDGIYYARSHHG